MLQHAVTFAAGLASEGLIPVCAIYSSFLQRAYDQVIHDVALQKLPGRHCGDVPNAPPQIGRSCLADTQESPLLAFICCLSVCGLIMDECS